jgi:SAM-dependent methyltransferase
MEKASSVCPLCRSEGLHHISPNLVYCRHCRIVVNEEHEEFTYSSEYFCSEYKTQYGKTYAEDFDAIYEASRKRLNTILSFLPAEKKGKGLSLIDVGSALGFFLKCASDHGIETLSGVEISEYGCNYSRSEFGIETVQTSFDDFQTEEKFDIVTAWYFIEHCSFPHKAIEKMFSMLRSGGILAAAMPSLSGPMYTFHRNRWIETHPGDHKIDFSPVSITRLLKNIGFKKVLIRPAGFHPERIVSEKSIFFHPFSFLYKWFVKAFRFSDTMEIFAVK